MNKLFRFTNAETQNREVEAWMDKHDDELGAIAKHWFQVMRECGSDVRELLHDGYPTACVQEAAFAYVGVFKAHVNVGFFRGAEIDDPQHLLEGTGKCMRHVKLRPDDRIPTQALTALVRTAYADMAARLKSR